MDASEVLEILRNDIKFIADHQPSHSIANSIGLALEAALMKSYLNEGDKKVNEKELIQELLFTMKRARRKLQIECGGERDYKGGQGNVATQFLFPEMDELIEKTEKYLQVK